MGEPSGPTDLTRLSRPEAEAFRFIASALGARFAGDSAPTQDRTNDGAGKAAVMPFPAPVPANDTRDAAAIILERVPTALLVADEDGIAFLNRAATQTLGYASPGALEAAGGLGALFSDGVSCGGLVPMVGADGTAFRARVEMAPIPWSGERATLLSILPEASGGTTERAGAARTERRAILDALREPAVIVTHDGGVLVANAAFRALHPLASDPTTLAERFNEVDRRAAVHAVRTSLATGRHADTPWPLTAAGQAFQVTAGAVDARDALLTLSRIGARKEPPALARAAATAVAQVRALVAEGSVLLSWRADHPGASAMEADRKAVAVVRALLLGTAAKLPVGSVMALSAGRTVTLSVRDAADPTGYRAAVPGHAAALARDMGCTVIADGASLTLAPIAEDALG